MGSNSYVVTTISMTWVRVFFQHVYGLIPILWPLLCLVVLMGRTNIRHASCPLGVYCLVLNRYPEMFKHKWSTRNGTRGEKHHLERCAMSKACNFWEGAFGDC